MSNVTSDYSKSEGLLWGKVEIFKDCVRDANSRATDGQSLEDIGAKSMLGIMWQYAR